MYPQSRPYSAEEFAAKTRLGGGDDRPARRRRDRLPGGLVARGARGGAGRRRASIRAIALAFITDGAWDGVAVACAVRAPWEIRAVERHKAFPAAMRLVKRKQSMAQIRSAPPAADASVDPERDPTFVPSQEDEGVRVAIDEFSRSVLQVTVGHARAPEVPAIEVFGTHLKSKLATPLDDPEYRDPAVRPHAAALGTALSTIRRIAEAAALRIIVDGVMRGGDRPAVVLGDLQRRHVLGRAGGALGAAELPGGGDEHGGGAQRHRALHRGAAAAAALARRRLLHPRVPQRARGDRPRAGQRAVLRLVGQAALGVQGDALLQRPRAGRATASAPTTGRWWRGSTGSRRRRSVGDRVGEGVDDDHAGDDQRRGRAPPARRAAGRTAIQPTVEISTMPMPDQIA